MAISALARDLTFALRMIGKRPLPSAVIVLTLAVGIGINVMFFTSFSAIVLRPLPFADPGRLMALRESQPRIGATSNSVAPANYLDWREHSRAFAEMAAVSNNDFNISADETPERVMGNGITAGLFPLLGIEPVLGRLFTAEDDRHGAPRVALIGYQIWTRQFGSDPGAIGSTILIDDRPHEVVGVMPPGMRFPHYSDIWVPLGLDSEDATRTTRYLDVVGRLAPNTTLASARAELSLIGARLAEQHPETNEGRSVSVRALRNDWLPPAARMSNVAQMVSVSFVLLILCANIANLILVQASARRQETAVRAALGAGRGALVRQFVTESMLLAVAGGVLGTVLSRIGAVWTISLVAIPLPYWVSTEMPISAWVYAVAISLAVGVAVGILPAFRSTRGDVYDALRSGDRGGGKSPGHRLRTGLVIVQLGVSLMLVVGSLLVVRGLMSPNRADRGHDVDHTLTLRLSLAGAAFDDAGDRVAYASEVVDRIEGLANVVAAGIANHLPASMSGWTKTNVEAEGRIPRAGEELETTYHPATAGYLTTLQVPLEAGRGFTRQEEVEGGDVVIVSRGMAQALWPNQDPVGRRLRTRLGDPRWLTVIGVVGDVEPARLLGGMNQAPPIQLYVPFAERPPTQIALVVRSIIEPRLMAAPVMAAIREYDARVPVFSVRPMREVLEQVYWIGKFVSQEFAVFGILALLIAAVGAYSVTAYSVSQRTREIGIRIALGARPGKVLRLVVRQGVGFGVGGALLGVALAVPMAVFLGKMFQDVRANDPTVFGGVTILLIGASVLASYVAARKAARVDPVEALAAE